MLRKRTRSHHKDQHMGHLTSDAVLESYFHSDVSGQKQKTSSFFNVPGLFVGFNPKGSESDSVRSPTSPLDFRLFSNFGNPFRSPRLCHEGHQKSWDSNKVGLSIIDSLDDETNQSGKVLRSSDSKNILFGPQMRIKAPIFRSHIDSFQAPKSLPKSITIFPYTQAKPSNLQKGNSDVLFEIGEGSSEQESIGNIRSCSLDSGRSGSRLTNFGHRNSRLSSGNFDSENPTNAVNIPSQSISGSFEVGDSSGSKLSSFPAITGCGTGLLNSLSASEIELSEDYTCVRTHGPNPKITHIFGDCVLECHGNELTNFSKNNGDVTTLPQEAKCSEVLTKYPSADFLSFCYSCKKKLDGEDIYMYRGEKAFCSCNCRSQEILIDEEMEETNNDTSEMSSESNSGMAIFENSLLTVTPDAGTALP